MEYDVCISAKIFEGEIRKKRIHKPIHCLSLRRFFQKQLKIKGE